MENPNNESFIRMYVVTNNESIDEIIFTDEQNKLLETNRSDQEQKLVYTPNQIIKNMKENNSYNENQRNVFLENEDVLISAQDGRSEFEKTLISSSVKKIKECILIPLNEYKESMKEYSGKLNSYNISCKEISEDAFKKIQEIKKQEKEDIDKLQKPTLKETFGKYIKK
jgi:hypothetical protein